MSCGEHGGQFDHTCDDCMLPANHYDPEQLNDLQDHKSADMA